MLRIKNTIPCPQCGAILRVSTRVVSDGREFEYYLCPQCKDVARPDPDSGEWVLAGTPSGKIPEIVQELRALAADEWMSRSTTRAPQAGGSR